VTVLCTGWRRDNLAATAKRVDANALDEHAALQLRVAECLDDNHVSGPTDIVPSGAGEDIVRITHSVPVRALHELPKRPTGGLLALLTRGDRLPWDMSGYVTVGVLVNQPANGKESRAHTLDVRHL
jgi:hypothetical protein